MPPTLPRTLPAPFDTVVFDLDGTLVDSEPDLRAAMNLLLDDLGRRHVSRAEVVMMIGDGIPKLVERALAATGGPVEGDPSGPVDIYSAYYAKAPGDLSTMFDGVPELLAQLQATGARVGICTNKPEKPAWDILKLFKVDHYIGAVIGGDTVPGVRKPNPGHLQAVLDALGSTPERAVMVGDNANDIDTAKALNVPAIAVSFGYAHGAIENLNTDVVIGHFNEFWDAVDGLA